MTVYILGFSGSLGSAKHSACTYIGYCDPGRLHERLALHCQGQGAAITRAAVQRGYTLKLLAAIDGDKTLERRLKNFKNARKAIAWIERQQRKNADQALILENTSQDDSAADDLQLELLFRNARALQRLGG